MDPYGVHGASPTFILDWKIGLHCLLIGVQSESNSNARSPGGPEMCGRKQFAVCSTGVNPAGDAGDTSPNIFVRGTSTGIHP